MAVIPRLVVRDDSSSSTTMTPTMVKLLIALLVLVFLGICLAGGLFILRARRKAKQIEKLTDLPSHASRSSKPSNHRRLTVTAAPYDGQEKPVYVYNEKEILIDESSQPNSPTSPVPEIRITFPEEEDQAGKSKSGRVMIVRISETGGLGLEPYSDEHLPAYQQSDAERFQSLDLERMGGLKELERDEKI